MAKSLMMDSKTAVSQKYNANVISDFRYKTVRTLQFYSAHNQQCIQIQFRFLNFHRFSMNRSIILVNSPRMASMRRNQLVMLFFLQVVVPVLSNSEWSPQSLRYFCSLPWIQRLGNSQDRGHRTNPCKALFSKFYSEGIYNWYTTSIYLSSHQLKAS